MRHQRSPWHSLRPGLIGVAFESLGTVSGLRRPTSGALVLAYHDVVSVRAASEPFAVTPSDLARQLRTLRTWGWTFVRLSELVERLRSAEEADGLAAVTFDDGQVGLLHLGVPVLTELAVPATVFVVAGALGTRPAWTATGGALMDEADLRQCLNAGLDVGCHSLDHLSLPDLGSADLWTQTHTARERLEDVTGQPVRHFAYPFGHRDTRTRDITAAAGFSAAFSFSRGRCRKGGDLYDLPRVDMARAPDRARLAYQISRSANPS